MSISTLGIPILGPWISNPASILDPSISSPGPPILGPFISIPPPVLGAFISTSTLGNPILGPFISIPPPILGPFISTPGIFISIFPFLPFGTLNQLSHLEYQVFSYWTNSFIIYSFLQYFP